MNYMNCEGLATWLEANDIIVSAWVKLSSGLWDLDYTVGQSLLVGNRVIIHYRYGTISFTNFLVNIIQFVHSWSQN